MIAKYRGEIFQKPAVIVLSAMICTALWGSAGPFIKLAYQFLAIPINNNLDKSLLAGIRFTLSGIVVLVLSLLRRRTIQSPLGAFSPSCLCSVLPKRHCNTHFPLLDSATRPAQRGPCSLPSAVSLLSFSALSYIKMYILAATRSWAVYSGLSDF